MEVPVIEKKTQGPGQREQYENGMFKLREESVEQH